MVCQRAQHFVLQLLTELVDRFVEFVTRFLEVFLRILLLLLCGLVLLELTRRGLLLGNCLLHGLAARSRLAVGLFAFLLGLLHLAGERVRGALRVVLLLGLLVERQLLEFALCLVGHALQFLLRALQRLDRAILVLQRRLGLVLLQLRRSLLHRTSGGLRSGARLRLARR